MTSRAVIIVLDGLGVGYMEDAFKYGDTGANTLKHIDEAAGGLSLPNLCRLGLGEISDLQNYVPVSDGNYGRMLQNSPGKDTTSGHWEITGVNLDFSFPVYPEGFPPEVIKEFEDKTGRKALGNYASSGTVILDELGGEHMRTGNPIVYTSADSVFQVAAHEDVISLEELYKICRQAREILVGPNSVSRVIARPFTGESKGKFKRNNAGRKDLSLEPPSETLLDILKNKGLISVGVGKIGDIFAHRGLTEEIKTSGNKDGVNKTIEAMEKYRGSSGLIFTNLVDFDTDYGHRRDSRGFADALEEFDGLLPRIINSLSEEDILFITADHGCDPEFEGHTDHTREMVPVLVSGKRIKKKANLGLRNTYADCGQTVADFLGIGNINFGTSFKSAIYGGN